MTLAEFRDSAPLHDSKGCHAGIPNGYPDAMPRTFLHASMPGPSAAGGIFGTLLNLLRLAMAVVFVFFFLFLMLGFAIVIGVLYLFGVHPKMPEFPKVNGFGFNPGKGPFAHATGNPMHTEPAPPEEQAEDMPKQLESFHGSLDEFMKDRKGPTS